MTQGLQCHSDGIIDGLDPDPDNDSNLSVCNGEATYTFTMQVGGTVICAVTEKITLQPGAQVQNGGYLLLIAPKIVFDPLSMIIPVFNGGVFKTISANPMAEIPPP